MEVIKLNHYTYILRSERDNRRYYIGYTTDLKKRLKKHNGGGVPSSSKFRPWYIETAISFLSKDKALAFEKYLKSHSGRAFAKKHF
ncbi:MAG: GIY-YIG nuclease family protein [Candidatus Cloacimonadota bacterium]|nr:GIY-YIG nuclease family protein [Candidatus Cloacimonadota bacterium]